MLQQSCARANKNFRSSLLLWLIPKALGLRVGYDDRLKLPHQTRAHATPAGTCACHPAAIVARLAAERITWYVHGLRARIERQQRATTLSRPDHRPCAGTCFDEQVSLRNGCKTIGKTKTLVWRSRHDSCSRLCEQGCAAGRPPRPEACAAAAPPSCSAT